MNMLDRESKSKEINLKDILRFINQSKLIVIFFTSLFLIISLVYSFQMKDWWTSKGRIAEVRVSNYSSLISELSPYKPIFEIYDENNNVIGVSDEYTSIIDPEKMIELFAQFYNSTAVKYAYLSKSSAFNNYLINNEIPQHDTTLIINEWYGKISASPVKSGGSSSKKYQLKFQADSSKRSFEMLNEYSLFVENMVKNEIFNDILATLSYKKIELESQLLILESRAEEKISAELIKTKTALNIATEANILEPIPNLNINNNFLVSLGKSGLSAKYNALKQFKDYSIFEPQISDIKSKIQLITTNEFDSNITFDLFTQDERFEEPLSKDKSTKKIFIIIITLLGFAIGISLSLIKKAIK